jgi:hypothetical protein
MVIPALLAKKDAMSAKTDSDANNAKKTGSLKITFALTAAVSDSLKSRTLAKNVLSTIAISATPETSEDARNVSKKVSYTITNATKSAPSEPLPLPLELANPAVTTALFAKTKIPALNVLMENFYKVKLANPFVTTASLLLMEFAHLART